MSLEHDVIKKRSLQKAYVQVHGTIEWINLNHPIIPTSVWPAKNPLRFFEIRTEVPYGVVWYTPSCSKTRPPWNCFLPFPTVSRTQLQLLNSKGNMKFCKNLQQIVEISDPAWAPYWTNYKMLKVCTNCFNNMKSYVLGALPSRPLCT